MKGSVTGDGAGAGVVMLAGGVALNGLVEEAHPVRRHNASAIYVIFPDFILHQPFHFLSVLPGLAQLPLKFGCFFLRILGSFLIVCQRRGFMSRIASIAAIQSPQPVSALSDGNDAERHNKPCFQIEQHQDIFRCSTCCSSLACCFTRFTNVFRKPHTISTIPVLMKA